MTKTYTLGMIDYNETGKKNCKATLEWELKDGIFSMSGTIWNPRETDSYCGGQCVDDIVKYFPDNAQAQSMLKIWERWHLNDMNAGSPAQRAWLEKNPIEPYDYTLACEALEKAGLNPDHDFIYEGKPYEYGSAWLKDELPPEIILEIQAWKDDKKINHLPTPEERDAFTAWIESAFDFSIDYIGENEKVDEYRLKISRKNDRYGQPKRNPVFRFSWSQGFGSRKDTMGRNWNDKSGSGMSYQFSPKKSALKIRNVIDALFKDAQAYDENRDFLDFAEAFGYEDKKEARRIHGACEKTYQDLSELFKGDFHKLLQDENYIPEAQAA